MDKLHQQVVHLVISILINKLHHFGQNNRSIKEQTYLHGAILLDMQQQNGIIT